jgi:hypothetical protein
VLGAGRDELRRDGCELLFEGAEGVITPLDLHRELLDVADPFAQRGVELREALFALVEPRLRAAESSRQVLETLTEAVQSIVTLLQLVYELVDPPLRGGVVVGQGAKAVLAVSESLLRRR